MGGRFFRVSLIVIRRVTLAGLQAIPAYLGVLRLLVGLARSYAVAECVTQPQFLAQQFTNL